MPGTISTFDDGWYFKGDSVYDDGYQIEVERVRPATDRPPAVVLQQMSQVMGELSADAVAYQQALTQNAAHKAAYEREKAKALTVLVHDYKVSGERVPGEDVRSALVAAELDQWYSPLLESTARVTALKASLDVKKALLMGLQSELRVLRDEAGL